MRTGIFYFSHKPYAGSRPFQLPGGDIGWIRVEERDASLTDALDAARPRKGEMVMNTHPLPRRKDV
jgi:hypothetical protein